MVDVRLDKIVDRLELSASVALREWFRTHDRGVARVVREAVLLRVGETVSFVPRAGTERVTGRVQFVRSGGPSMGYIEVATSAGTFGVHRAWFESSGLRRLAK